MTVITAEERNALNTARISSTERLPQIDLHPWLFGDRAARKEVARQIADACTRYGFFYLYRQLLRQQHSFANGETVDAYLEAASRLIFPGKPFRQAMSDAAILLSTDILPRDASEAAAFAEIQNLAFRSIQLLLFQANFIESQLTKQACTPSTIVWDAFMEVDSSPTIQTPTQLPPPAKLTKLDVYALAPIPELAPTSIGGE